MRKSSFIYWYKHWVAYQRTAIKLKAWKFRYLFHDMEKPFLNLILPYAVMSSIHKRISRHHTECIFKIDWEALVIDWECSQLTKPDSPLTAYEYLTLVHKRDYNHIMPILIKFNLLNATHIHSPTMVNSN